MKKMMNKIALPTNQERYMAICDILEENEFEYRIQERNSRRGCIVRNIIIPARQKENKLVLMAHYDVVPGSCGANDNASSICCIIEFMKRGGRDLPYVEVVFTDLEEFGTIGCRQYIEEYGDSIKEVINIDTCGVGSKIVEWNKTCRTYSGALFDELPDHVIEVDHLPYCDADCILFNGKGIGVSCLCILPDECTRNVYNSYGGKLCSTGGIFPYIHCGEFDDISYIDYNALELMVRYLMRLL